MVTQNFTLDKLEVELQKWGKDQGKHTGKIKFTDGQENSFTINLDQDKIIRLITLVADEIVDSAEQLSSTIKDSLSTIQTPALEDKDVTIIE